MEPDSPASTLLKPGDIITNVNDWEVDYNHHLHHHNHNHSKIGRLGQPEVAASIFRAAGNFITLDIERFLFQFFLCLSCLLMDLLKFLCLSCLLMDLLKFLCLSCLLMDLLMHLLNAKKLHRSADIDMLTLYVDIVENGKQQRYGNKV